MGTPSWSGPGLSGTRVLIVEDHAPSARLMVALLASEASEVRAVGDAETALATLADFPARIVVIDLILPGMSGLVLAERIAARASAPPIALVAVSALAGPEILDLAQAAGCAAFVSKPIDTATFPDLLADLLAE